MAWQYSNLTTSLSTCRFRNDVLTSSLLTLLLYGRTSKITKTQASKTGYRYTVTTDARPSRSTERLRWTDVHQPWEVTSTVIGDVITSERSKQEVEQAILASHTQDRSASSQQRNSRKRRYEEEFFGRSKKARVDSEPKPKPFRLHVVEEQSNLLPHLRCAYYATERLASAWYLTYSMTIELEGMSAAKFKTG